MQSSYYKTVCTMFKTSKVMNGTREVNVFLGGGGGAPLYELYKYLQPQKCGSLNYFCLTNGSWILPFRWKNRCGSISFHLQMKRREREVARRDLPLQTCKGEPRLGLKTCWISEARSENESRK